MSEVKKADLYDILTDRSILWEELRDNVVLVTGATGLIGGMLIRVLSVANKQHGLNMRIIAHGRNKDVGEILSQELDLEFVSGDIRKPSLVANITGKIDYIFHSASITKSADMVEKPVDVILTAVLGTRNMLELAKDKNCKSFVYLSSMEVYGQTKTDEVCENDLGFLDLLNPRSSYPESKRLCENLCSAYYTQYGLPVKIARLAQTFGAVTPKDDTRVFAQFARSAINGDDIVLHTEGKSRGNYCYISDAVRALFTLAVKGINGQAYNVANTAASATIREMAELVADEYGVKVKTEIPNHNLGYAPEVGYRLNADKLKSLGWQARFGLADMYKRMIADWQES